MGAVDDSSMFAVVPVLVGPLQALLALLPALFVGLVAFLAALFTPAGFRRTLRFFWRQKIFTLLLVAIVASVVTGWPWRRLLRGSHAGLAVGVENAEDWPTFRGNAARQGRGADDRDPALGVTVWEYAVDPAVYASPAVSGDLVIFSTAGGISPFNPTGTGAIVAVDAVSGAERWRYAPDDFRATFSSPVVSDGRVICGEGLHQVQDARITCLDLTGRLQWEFRTASHVEATAAVADGRVFVGAGSDGFYCLSLKGDGKGGPLVLWHLEGREFPDCESSPLVVDDLVIFGLGEEGQALCAVDAATGELRWRIETPYPVFTSPSLIPATGTSGPKLAVAMGNGNFVQSAAEVLEQKLAQLREAGASRREIEDAERRLAPGGQIWGVDLATHQVDWRYLLDDTVLGSIAVRDQRLYFGCRDGSVHCLSARGEVVRSNRLQDAIVSSPALGHQRLYVSTNSGRLFALDAETLRPVWDVSLGEGQNFTSSPVVAHGHVYVGAQTRGLVCLGTTGENDSQIWNRGELGGLADFDALPPAGRIVGSWPPPGDRQKVELPLAAVDGHVVAVARTAEQQRIVRLDFDANAGETARIVWQRRAGYVLDFPPLIAARRLITLEVYQSPDSTERPPIDMMLPHLTARDVESGADAWRMAVPPERPRSWTCDARWVYLIYPRIISVFGARDGVPGWSIYLDAEAKPSLAFTDDIVLVSDGRDWTALDSGGGTRLWKVPSEQSECTVLDAQGAQFLAAVRDSQGAWQVQLRQVLDGRLIWQTPGPSAGKIAWAKLSAEAALLVSASGSWQLLRLADGLPYEFSREEAAAAIASTTAPGGSDKLLRSSTLVYRTQVLDANRDGLQLFGLDDGQPRPWFAWEEHPRPATSLVGARGRVYFANEQGRVICLGSREPTP